jgi:predicted phage terminase large subunit-like protein
MTDLPPLPELSAPLSPTQRKVILAQLHSMGLRTTGDLRRLLAKVQAEQQRRAEQRERFDLDKNAAAIRERCRTLIGFVREAWHVLEPRTQFVEGWVTRAICDHLQAITRGTFLNMGWPNRLRMNVPPGFTKSLTTSVMWNAWEWGPCDLAHMRFFSTSYDEGYVRRDTRKTRDLILSPWYQRLWGEDAEGEFRNRVRLTRYGETSFENTSKGSREGVPFNRLTSGRGERLTIDDPLSVAQAKSDAEREHAKFVMRESVPSRVNNPITSATVLIMQRVHKDDPSGVWESLGVRHVALVLPMRFIAKKRCTTPIFTDPRQVEGELLFPERFPMSVVDAVETTEMTVYAVSGQHQQEPIPREGGMFKRAWFKPRADLPRGYRWVRHWDLADTEETYGADPPYTAGVLLGKPLNADTPYCVADVVRCRDEAPTVRKLVKNTAALDHARINAAGGTYEIQVPQDPGSAGKTVARDMVSMLVGYNAHKLIETGSKIDRAEPFATQAENGNVEIVIGPWNDAYLEEMTNFPGAKFKDQTDATSGGHSRLLKPPRQGMQSAGPQSIPLYGR